MLGTIDREINIRPLDEQAMEDARARLDSLSKPLGSLGRLEEYAVELAGIRGYTGGALEKRAVLVFAADNGIHAQGITPVPKSVTQTQAICIAHGRAGVSVLAAQAGAEVLVYNVGVELPINDPSIVYAKVMDGTNDITQGPAMSREQCERAILAGYDAVEKLGGCDVIGLGEMGICNTATSTAVAAVLLGQQPEELTGRGAGITDAHFERKKRAIRKAIETNKPDANDIVDVLAKVGGLDIAAMTGAYIACAQYRIPVVIDGYISAVAALCACRMQPSAGTFMFASHRSNEPGHAVVMQALGMEPAFDLRMRLGEGSGCPLMFHVLEGALRVVDDMGTLEESNVDAGDLVDIR